MTQIEATNGYALAQDEGTAYWFLGALATSKATSMQTDNTFAIQEHIYAPGLEPPPHIHHHQDESFYVLEGAAMVMCGEQTWRATTGSFAFLPRGIVHTFKIEGNAPLKILVITSPGGPAGFEHFVEEMGEPALELRLPPPAPPDMAKLQMLAAKYEIELVGIPA